MALLLIDRARLLNQYYCTLIPISSGILHHKHLHDQNQGNPKGKQKHRSVKILHDNAPSDLFFRCILSFDNIIPDFSFRIPNQFVNNFLTFCVFTQKEALGDNHTKASVLFYKRSNISFRILLTTPGSAFPWVAFMVCPTRNPMAFFFPAL